jgi:hemerythrin superfamily protein
MNAITLLISDHEEVADLFMEFDKASEAKNEAQEAELAVKICKALAVHATIEEELFYPAAREVFNDEDEKQIDEAIHEHALIKKLVTDIKTLETGLRLNLELKVLQKMVEHHAEEEETEMFPLLNILGMEIDELGSKMEARKQELLAIL